MEVRAGYPEDSGPRNFSWIVSGELAAMACPSSAAQLKTLAARGLNHLVSLSEEALPPGLSSNLPRERVCDFLSTESSTSTPPSEEEASLLKEKRAASDTSKEGVASGVDSSNLPSGIESYAGRLNWLLIPVEEYCAPTMRQVVRFIEFCLNCRQRGEPVGVHCRSGRGRTGVVAACYLVYFLEMTPERAITTVRLSRPGSIETYRQERTVYEFRDLIRLHSYDSLVLSLLQEPSEEISLLHTEVRREEEKKLQLSYFQREQIKKEMKVLDYNTIHCFLQLVRKYIPFNPNLLVN